MRRVRLAHGLDAERGRPIRVNGNGAALGLELMAAGLSVRASATLAGVPKSTLADRARCGARRQGPLPSALRPDAARERVI